MAALPLILHPPIPLGSAVPKSTNPWLSKAYKWRDWLQGADYALLSGMRTSNGNYFFFFCFNLHRCARLPACLRWLTHQLKLLSPRRQPYQCDNRHLNISWLDTLIAAVLFHYPPTFSFITLYIIILLHRPRWLSQSPSSSTWLVVAVPVACSETEEERANQVEDEEEERAPQWHDHVIISLPDRCY